MQKFSVLFVLFVSIAGACHRGQPPTGEGDRLRSQTDSSVYFEQQIVQQLLSGKFVLSNTESLRRFEQQIVQYERADCEKFPPEDAILFVGSSTVKWWKTLEEDMSPLPVINRGFGGATVPEVLYYTDRIVLPYRPEIIVFYAGDNDLTRDSITPRATFEYFKLFERRVHRFLPETYIFFVSIKPSYYRMRHWHKMQQANAMIRRFTAETAQTGYIDVATPMLQGKKMPPRHYFARDGVHLSPGGYAVWRKTIKPVLLKKYHLPPTPN